MKKLITLLLIPLLFTSCGVSIHSVTDDTLVKEPYSNPLVVIAYKQYGPRNFSNRLKDKIELQFQEDQREVEVLVFEKPHTTGLELNVKNEMEENIKMAITNGKKDLLLIFQPSYLGYANGDLQVATYDWVGIDTRTEKEVWKGSFTSNSFFGPSFFAENSARKIYEQLKKDKIL